MSLRRSRDLVALLAIGVAVSTIPMLNPDTPPGPPSSSAPAVSAGPVAPVPAQQVTSDPPTVRSQRVLDGDRPVDRGVISSDPSTAPASAPTEEILPRELSGEQMLRRGDQLAEIAQRNRIDVPRLRALLAGDETVFVNTRGRVYFVDPRGEADQLGEEVEEPLVAPAAEAAALGSTPGVSRRYPNSETFRLNSNPAATRTIFIDADGATVNNTAWNDARNAGTIPNGTWAGWNSQGPATTFTDAEHAWIQEVWRQVAEAYAAFDVNVTTQDRGPAAYIRSSLQDTAYGSQVVITTSPQPAQAVCGGQCLGVAYIGTFGDRDSGQHQPAWVFVDSGDSATIAAQAVSHEVGHNLNLGHDAKPGSGYYAGTSSWGPIMGSAMSRAVSHWSRGEYSNPSNTQDDLAVMQQQGLPLRADDHGNDTRSARALGTAASYDVEGIISTRTDVDVFRLDLGCETTLAADARGVGPQTTLDLALDLLDSSGTRLQSSSPASGHSNRVSTGMNAALTRTVGPGTYYLRVDGVASGSGSIPQGTGWSDYASLGQYRLTATGCTTSTSAVAPSASSSPSPDVAPVTPAGPTPTPSAPLTTAPSAPRSVSGLSGRSGRPITATVRWVPPAQDGGTAVTGYRVSSYQLAKNNRSVKRTYRTGAVDDSVRVLQLTLPRGRYSFSVQAINAAGSSPWSARSKVAVAR